MVLRAVKINFPLGFRYLKDRPPEMSNVNTMSTAGGCCDPRGISCGQLCSALISKINDSLWVKKTVAYDSVQYERLPEKVPEKT